MAYFNVQLITISAVVTA